MGTTVVAIVYRKDGAWRAHVGDSRLYCYREAKLEQVTDDHTWVARALKMGDITSAEAKSHPWRHVLFQCLGRKDLKTVEIARLEPKSEDIFLLCSDGLTEEVPDPNLLEIFQSNSPLEDIAPKLIEAAKAGGGSDNITVVLVAQD